MSDGHRHELRRGSKPRLWQSSTELVSAGAEKTLATSPRSPANSETLDAMGYPVCFFDSTQHVSSHLAGPSGNSSAYRAQPSPRSFPPHSPSPSKHWPTHSATDRVCTGKWTARSSGPVPLLPTSHPPAGSWTAWSTMPVSRFNTWNCEVCAQFRSGTNS